MAKGSWGYYIQGNYSLQEIEKLGSKLSKTLHCPVHFPAFGKNIFECKCGTLFPVYLVRAAESTGDWEAVIAKHSEVDNE